MTEFASYIKVLVTFQRGMWTAKVESQRSTFACAVLSLRLSLMCVVDELARSAAGSFISAWNITVVRSALENQGFLHVLFRYVRCRLGIISMGKKTLIVVPLTSFKLTLGLQAVLKCICLKSACHIPNSTQRFHFPLRPWKVMAHSI